LVGNPERKRPLWRQRRKYDDNIKVNIKETAHEALDWIKLAQYRY